MNILPKKRWHVRTKENIARVRKDEAEAAEKERQEQLRIETADREARLNVLKLKSKEKLLNHNIEQPDNEKPVTEHINLFQNLEQAVQTTNKEHDTEIKDKKEEYEKKIGYLTYLGQDTNEALRKQNWYEVLPEASRFSRCNTIKDTYDKLVLKDADGKPKLKDPDVKDGEVDYKSKKRHDPINNFLKYCSKEKFKTKTAPSKSSDINKISEKVQKVKKCNKKEEKMNKLEKLRAARLKREQQEKIRTESFLKGLHGEEAKEKSPPPKIKPKYNSQFNPDLARQNFYRP